MVKVVKGPRTSTFHQGYCNKDSLVPARWSRGVDGTSKKLTRGLRRVNDYI